LTITARGTNRFVDLCACETTRVVVQHGLPSKLTVMSDAEPPEPETVSSPAVVASLVANHRQFLAFVQRRVGRCVSELAEALKPEYAAALRRIAAVRVVRAREALRKQVARSCGTCAEHGCLDCSCKRLS
jgi:hypothetical protein